LTPNLIEIGCSRRGDPRTHPVAEIDRGRGSATALGGGDVAAERVDRPLAIARLERERAGGDRSEIRSQAVQGRAGADRVAQHPRVLAGERPGAGDQLDQRDAPATTTRAS
jgi:hypothetical protein